MFKNLGIVSLSLLFAALFASCAKENLPPPEEYTTETYNLLYMVQASGVGESRIKIYTNVKNLEDTTFNLYSVALGGLEPAPKDIPLNFQALGQEWADAYNLANRTNLLLLPPDTYTIETSTVIKKGANSTPTLPVKIQLPKLQKFMDYLLPVSFTSGDTSYKADHQRKVAYFIFRTTVDPTPKYIGTIPALTNDSVRVFDFFEDLMVQDMEGKLWLYRMENRDVISEPILVATGFDSLGSMFFNDGLNRIYGISYKAADRNYMYSWPVTDYPNITIGKPRIEFWESNMVNQYWIRMWSGLNGMFYGAENTSSNSNRLNRWTPTEGGWSQALYQVGSGWTPATFRMMTTIRMEGVPITRPSAAIITGYTPDNLMAYTLHPQTGNFSTVTSIGYHYGPWNVGQGFFKYKRFFSMNFHRDLVIGTETGTLYRYKDFDITGLNYYIAPDKN